jgi:hypothetical protein
VIREAGGVMKTSNGIARPSPVDEYVSTVKACVSFAHRSMKLNVPPAPGTEMRAVVVTASVSGFSSDVTVHVCADATPLTSSTATTPTTHL